MRIGVSLNSTFPGPDPRTGPRYMIERAAAAAAAGLDLLCVGDHHLQPDYVQNTPMLGRLLAEWTARTAGCLFLVPLWHPVLMAEHIATLAAIHDGPFIVQTGLGYGEHQFTGMGIDIGRRPSRFEEGVRVVRGLLGGETVSSDLHGIRDARLGARPPAPVEWWIGAGAGPAVDRAARLGDGLYTPPGSISSTLSAVGRYREGCAAHGRTPSAIAARVDLIVLDDGDAARRAAAEIIAAGYRGGLPLDSVLAGTASDMAEQLAPLRAAGVTDVVARCMTVPQPLAIETVHQLAEVRRLLG